MHTMNVRTRFAPSPTGRLHTGNARTALFSALLAAQQGGEFILRIEDTDAERSRREHETTLIADLHWLGLSWQEGPDVGGRHGPYRQSERAGLYHAHLGRLAEAGQTYPCFCTPAELALARKVQLAAGQPPRYAGTCAKLSTREIEARLARGLKPALRFRVPESGETAFDDLIRGPQHFAHKDIGDFVIRRADGSPAFFFSNALDDALMEVTHVLRGEDHLSNTPRQLLLLSALGLPAPHYGHLALVVGEGGAPLSKREGGGSLETLRNEGLLPEALRNYLARLGHSYAANALMTFAELARAFDLRHIGHAPAHFDHAQLAHWQREAIHHAGSERLWAWFVEAHPELSGQVPEARRAEFVEAVRGNVMRPVEALEWARIVFGELPPPDSGIRTVLNEAGRTFFEQALKVVHTQPADFSAFAMATAAATRAKGKRLYQPLRAALTGCLHGPEMERLWPLLGAERIERRLRQAAGHCG